MFGVSRESIEALAAGSSLAALYLDLIYGSSINQLVGVIFGERHSYLIVMVVMAITGLFVEYRDIRILSGLDLGSILVGSTILSLSFTTLFLSDVMASYSLQFKALSLIFFIWGLTVLILDRESIRRLSGPLLGLLLAVPLSPVFDGKGAFPLTLVNRWLVSSVVGGGPIYVSGTGVYLVRMGSHAFEVTYLIDGFNVFMNIVGLALIVLFISRRVDMGLGQRLKNILLLIGLSTIVLYVAYILRLVILRILIDFMGYDAANTFYLYVPSFVYSLVVAVVTGFICFMVFRDFGIGSDAGRGSPGSLSVHLVAVFLLSIFFVSLVRFTYLNAGPADRSLIFWGNLSLVLGVASLLYVVVSIFIKYWGVVKRFRTVVEE